MRKKGRRLAITQLGQPVLRQRSVPIPQLTHPALQQLIDDMIVTMKKAEGVGIAAPQVGVGARVFIVAPQPNKRYPHAPHQAPVAMINPRLLAHSKETVLDWEGCLSIPGIRGMVPRYRWVEIEYWTREGKKVRKRLKNFVARIFQHEFDHINGKVFVDRVRDRRTFATDYEYSRQAMWRRRPR